MPLPRPARPLRPLLRPLLRSVVPSLLVALLVASGCGAGGAAPPGSNPTSSAPPPEPAPRSELAAHAAAAQDRVGVSVYTFTAGDEAARSVLVVRAEDGTWRVDVPGGALGGTVDVSVARTADGLFQCALAAPPEPGECVRVDGALGPEADPRVQHVFTDWLDVLTDRSAALAVTASAPPEGVGGRCFTVQPSATSLEPPLDAGVYCFEPDGTLTGARLDLGELTLAGADGTAPPTVELPGPVVDGPPLPTASPTPPPTPSPTPSAGAPPTG